MVAGIVSGRQIGRACERQDCSPEARSESTCKQLLNELLSHSIYLGVIADRGHVLHQAMLFKQIELAHNRRVNILVIDESRLRATTEHYAPVGEHKELSHGTAIWTLQVFSHFSHQCGHRTSQFFNKIDLRSRQSCFEFTAREECLQRLSQYLLQIVTLCFAMLILCAYWQVVGDWKSQVVPCQKASTPVLALQTLHSSQ